MSKGIKVNNGHVNEVATQIETAKSYFRHVPLVPQDSKTTISANSKSKEAYGNMITWNYSRVGRKLPQSVT